MTGGVRRAATVEPARSRLGLVSKQKRRSARPGHSSKSGEGDGGASDESRVSALKTLTKSKRKEFSAATKWAAWVRSGSHCEGWVIGDTGILFRCNASLAPLSYHYDHIDNVWTSHDNSLANCQILCIPCHAAKTKRDVKQIAKIKRIIKKRLGLKKTRRPLPFGRGSKLKKKVNGKVVRRVHRIA